MEIYRVQLTVNDPHELVLRDIPFAAGDVVEIVVRKPGKESLGDRWRELMEDVRRNPATKSITEEDIAAEIEAYRSGS